MHYGRIGFYRDAFPLPEDGGKRHAGKEMLHQRHGTFVVFVAGYGQEDTLPAKGFQEGFDAGVGTGVFPEVFPISGDEFGAQGGGSFRGVLPGRKGAFDEFVDAVAHQVAVAVQGMGWVAVPFHQVVARGGQVAQGVEQRAVQVENHQFFHRSLRRIFYPDKGREESSSGQMFGREGKGRLKNERIGGIA